MVAYVTPNGTAWKSYQASIAGHRYARWMIADDAVGNANIPAVLYCHGAGGLPNQFETSPGSSAPGGYRDFRNWLMDSGYLVIEGTGGPSDADGQQGWGAAFAADAYRAYFDHVDGLFDIGTVTPHGRSMGGPVAYALALDTVIRARMAGLVINSGITDLIAAYAGGRFNPILADRYGAPTVNPAGTPTSGRVPEPPENVAAFAALASGRDPMQFPLASWDGIKALQLVGTADETVPMDDHGLAMRARWAGRPTIDRLDTRLGGDHSNANGSYVQVDAMSQFMVDVTGVGIPTGGGSPSDERIYRVIGGGVMIGGNLHPTRVG